MSVSRKPHNDRAGYVCELKCRLGGHIVIYDREQGFEVDADYRWIVMHEPSSLHIAVKSEADARTIMKGVARAATPDEALEYADILPDPKDGCGAELPPLPEASAAGVRFIWGLDHEATEISPHHVFACRAYIGHEVAALRERVDLGPDGDPRTDPRRRTIERELLAEVHARASK